ncbi:unnamed protein product, partial [Prorocentrum cordatum]
SRSGFFGMCARTRRDALCPAEGRTQGGQEPDAPAAAVPTDDPPRHPSQHHSGPRHSAEGVAAPPSPQMASAGRGCNSARWAKADPSPAVLLPVGFHGYSEPATPAGSWRASLLGHRPRHVNTLRRIPGGPLSPPALPPGARHRPTSRSMFKPFSAPGGREGLGFRLHVAAGQEALYCYQKKGDEAPAGELELALRAPLLLATAALAPGAKQMVSVTLATPEVLECMGGMQILPGEARSRFQETPMLPAGGGRGALTFECASERNAQQLMDQLSAAGCTLQGLTDRYRLRKEVGRGGFGRVYLAHDTWNGEEVAVKVFLNKPGAKRNQFHPLREATMLRWSEDPLFPHFKA